MDKKLKTVLTALGMGALAYAAYKAFSTPGTVEQKAEAAVSAPVQIATTTVEAASSAISSTANAVAPAVTGAADAASSAIKRVIGSFSKE